MPNQPDQLQFTSPALNSGDPPTLKALIDQKFSSNANSPTILRMLVESAREAVDEARSALTALLDGPETPAITAATREYILAAEFARQAQRELSTILAAERKQLRTLRFLPPPPAESKLNGAKSSDRGDVR